MRDQYDAACDYAALGTAAVFGIIAYGLTRSPLIAVFAVAVVLGLAACLLHTETARVSVQKLTSHREKK